MAENWHARPHAELDATGDKWLMLDAPGGKPLSPPPDEVIRNFARLTPALQEYLREHGYAPDETQGRLL